MPETSSQVVLLAGVKWELAQALHAAFKMRGFQVIVAGNYNDQQKTDAGISIFELDAGAPTQIDQLMDHIDSAYARLDVLVNAMAVLAELPGLGARNRPQGSADARGLMAYPPYRLYDAVIERMRRHGYGRIVNLYGGMDAEGVRDPKSLTQPSLRALAEHLAETLRETDIRFNSVSTSLPVGAPGEERARILRERLETILWLATLAGERPNRQFFRGYADS